MLGRLVIYGAAAGLLFCAASKAETLDAAQWHFKAVFPCQSGVSSQTIDSEIGKLIFTTYSCEDASSGAFMVGINDFPAGTIKAEEIGARYALVLDGMAKEVKGTIRNVAVFSLGGTDGREAIIDTTEPKGAVKSRFFLVGDRLYQALCAGSVGIETGSVCKAFLDSFVLTGIEPPKTASPSPK
jgi:hypothetical protein